MKQQALLALGMAAATACGSSPARAGDSCWNHNGSIVRLEANGDLRRFVYEDPRPSLRAAGVEAGTMLFEGSTKGSRYYGKARVFSASCPGEPLDYFVSGPVNAARTQVTLSGKREVYVGCRPTGRFKVDRLVFTYQYQC